MTEPEESVRERPLGETLRLIGGGALTVLLVIFALLNLGEVEVNWIFGTWSTPLTAVIAVGLIVGALIDRLILRRTPGSRSNREP